MELSINRESLFEYIRKPISPHNPCFKSAAERCIELFLEEVEGKDISKDFIGWFKLRNIYALNAQYGVAHTTRYYADGHNKFLKDIASSYKEIYHRIVTVTQSSLWDA